MDVKKLASTTQNFFKKYRYVLLILAIGIVLMCLPGRTNDTPAETEPAVQEKTTDDLAEKMEALLSSVEGAGKVKVLLTQSVGEQYIYQSDSDISENNGSSSERNDTVIITDSNRNQQAVLSQIIPPSYCGAVILCQGGDQPAVRLAIVEAVSKLTGLGADRICVLKMK